MHAWARRGPDMQRCGDRTERQPSAPPKWPRFWRPARTSATTAASRRWLSATQHVIASRRARIVATHGNPAMHSGICTSAYMRPSATAHPRARPPQLSAAVRRALRNKSGVQYSRRALPLTGVDPVRGAALTAIVRPVCGAARALALPGPCAVACPRWGMTVPLRVACGMALGGCRRGT